MLAFEAMKRLKGFPSFRAPALLLTMAMVLSGCSYLSKRSQSVSENSPEAKASALDRAISELSLAQLSEAETVFRVAYDKSLESWQGAGEDAVPGCKIGGPEAEKALAALRPWVTRRAREEATRLNDSPRAYQLPINVESCDADCSCGFGLKILEEARLDEQSHQKVKDLKRSRARLEAKSELLTGARAELCAESATWICKSDVLKALK